MPKLPPFLAPYCALTPPLLSVLHILLCLIWTLLTARDLRKHREWPEYPGYCPICDSPLKDFAEGFLVYFFVGCFPALLELWLWYAPARAPLPQLLLCDARTKINGVYFLTRACVCTTLWAMLGTGFNFDWYGRGKVPTILQFGVFMMDLVAGVNMVKEMQKRGELKVSEWADGEYHGMEEKGGGQTWADELMEAGSEDDDEEAARGRSQGGRLLILRERWGAGRPGKQFRAF
ncbi:hypothetical protein EDC01DRAFT_670573 [Geopyxis carbonaria]|nr:hypothetical protein EDC01DRAFT_670573 [Geopyxis carbonaria]